MKAATLGAVTLALLGLAFIADNYVLRLASFLLLYSVHAISWNFIGGLAGYPSFATAAFFGLGAYSGAVAQLAGLAMPLAWAMGAIVPAVFAAGLGVAVLRLRGHYFAIASLIVGEVLREVANTWTSLTGGGMGLNLPILDLDPTTEARFFYLSLLGLAAVTLVVAAVVRNSSLGFALQCIKQNEGAAGLVGIDASSYKMSAFILSAVFVGTSGAVYASMVKYIEPLDVFDILISIKTIVMVLLGGSGTLFGPVVGAAVFLLLEEAIWRNFLMIHAGLLGLIIVAVIFFLPGGLAALDVRRLARTAWRP